MSKLVKQLRYYGEGHEKNFPHGIDLNSLKTGSIFWPNIPILSLGIQSIPGTKFYINNSEYPVVIGYPGVYELKLEESAPIYSIFFDAESLLNISNNGNAYLIIDFIYEGEFL